MSGLNDIRIYCDEATDASLMRTLQRASDLLNQIPDANITIYPEFSQLGEEQHFLLELVREDRPDFVFCLNDIPFLVLEITEHGYTGDNPLQRFTRFTTSAEQGIPFLYFTPFARNRDDELDLTTDPSTLSKRHVNSNVFLGMTRLAEIFHVPLMAVEWTTAANGKPKKLGSRPSTEKIKEVFGGLIEVLELIVGELAEKIVSREDVTSDSRVIRLQKEVYELAETPNVRGSAVKLSLPPEDVMKLVCEPVRLLEFISQENYFFKDKPERLITLLCILESTIEFVEMPDSTVVNAGDVRTQLSAIFGSPRFCRNVQIYCTGYKWRSDPHCGVLANLDYIECRANNARTPESRDKALVLFYPRVSLRDTSSTCRRICNELNGLYNPSSKLYSLFEERYANDDPAARREGFQLDNHPVGLWSDNTKQARIFRKHCDLIVLSDGILIGNHWKSRG